MELGNFIADLKNGIAKRFNDLPEEQKKESKIKKLIGRFKRTKNSQ